MSFRTFPVLCPRTKPRVKTEKSTSELFRPFRRFKMPQELRLRNDRHEGKLDEGSLSRILCRGVERFQPLGR